MIPVYSLFYIIPLLGLISLSSRDVWTFSLPIFAFILVPVLDFWIGKKIKLSNLLQKSDPFKDRAHSFLLYSLIPIHFALLAFFLLDITSEMPDYVRIGRILSMGLLCGITGINVAHELGHRKRKFEKIFSLSLLMSSLYMHFYIEHNRGHHRNVATFEDPASARKDEHIYAFLWRCIPASFLHAISLEKHRLYLKNKSFWSADNLILRFIIIESIWLTVIGLTLGVKVLLYYLIVAMIGIVLLECIDYIEHYGLKRKEIQPGIYELVTELHSWNCDYLPGRLLLFELPLHPSHHKNSQIPYHQLESTPKAPQMPLGYPAMVLLSLIPPLWYKIIHPLLPKVTLEEA